MNINLDFQDTPNQRSMFEHVTLVLDLIRLFIILLSCFFHLYSSENIFEQVNAPFFIKNIHLIVIVFLI